LLSLENQYLTREDSLAHEIVYVKENGGFHNIAIAWEIVGLQQSGEVFPQASECPSIEDLALRIVSGF
jgi:hypothetical protein